jgi:acetyl esterase/lipase
MLAEADQDLTAMLETVRAQARPLAADPSRIALVAYSAGGPLLARPLRQELPGVRALAGFYPFLDLRKSPLHQKYLAPDAVTAFSPAAQLRTPVAHRMPFFLARAGKDTIPDILPGIDAFVAESLAAGTPLTLFNHPEAPHGFDHDPDPRTREVLRAFLAFLATHLVACSRTRLKAAPAGARGPWRARDRRVNAPAPQSSGRGPGTSWATPGCHSCASPSSARRPRSRRSTGTSPGWR